MLGGCDLVFGVDPPAPIVPHTGTLERQLIFDGESGVVVQSVPYAPSELVARVFQGSEELPIVWDYATSAFAFDAVESEPYRLVLESPLERAEIQSTHTSLALHSALFQRPAAEFPIGQTELDLMITNPQSGAHRLVTTGVWSDVAFRPTLIDPATATHVLEWPATRALVSTTQHDRVFLVAEVDQGAYRAIGRYDTATLDMVTGKNELQSTLQPPTLPARCTTITAPLQALDQRVAQTFPSFIPFGPASWGIFGVPAPELSLSVFLFLAESNNAAEAASVELIDPYALPHHAQAVAYRVRNTPTGDATMIPMYALIRVIVPAASEACPTSVPTTIPAGTLGLPASFRFAGELLDYAGYAPISLAGTTEVELTWEAQDGELHGIVLFDVTDATAYTQPVRQFQTTEPRIVIESASLVDGRRYVAIVQTNRGYADVARGNFVDHVYPFEVAIVTSPVFEVKR